MTLDDAALAELVRSLESVGLTDDFRVKALIAELRAARRERDEAKDEAREMRGLWREAILHRSECANGHQWFSGDRFHHHTAEGCPECHLPQTVTCPPGCIGAPRGALSGAKGGGA